MDSVPAACRAIMEALPGPSPKEAMEHHPESVLVICNLEPYMLEWTPVSTFTSTSKYGKTIVEVLCKEGIIKWSSGKGGTLWVARRKRRRRR